MEKLQNSNSGLSAPSPQLVSLKYGRIFKAMCCALIVVLGYIAFLGLSRDGSKQLWAWKLGGNTNGEHQAGGSQYLLGVGKADITGYVLRYKIIVCQKFI